MPVQVNASAICGDAQEMAVERGMSFHASRKFLDVIQNVAAQTPCMRSQTPASVQLISLSCNAADSLDRFRKQTERA